jgi:hypothetical protein
MTIQFFRRHNVWLPTLLGWGCLLALAAALFALWWVDGESFLSRADRRPAAILVIEGWAGLNSPPAAAAEFQHGGYQWAVVAGGLTGKSWTLERWRYVDAVGQELIRLGVRADAIIAAPTGDPESQRTYEMAVAARVALRARGIEPKALNVFTLGAHARRSQLIFRKVFGPATSVGVVSWIPPGFRQEPWWHSSERADDLLKETVGYAFELLLSSGRIFHSAPEPLPGKPAAEIAPVAEENMVAGACSQAMHGAFRPGRQGHPFRAVACFLAANFAPTTASSLIVSVLSQNDRSCYSPPA